MQLMFNQVAIRLPEVSVATKAGIILPESAIEVPQYGEVIALGEGKRIGSKLIPYEVNVGDHVLFAKYAGTQVRISDNEYYLLLTENDILAVVQ